SGGRPPLWFISGWPTRFQSQIGVAIACRISVVAFVFIVNIPFRIVVAGFRSVGFLFPLRSPPPPPRWTGDSVGSFLFSFLFQWKLPSYKVLKWSVLGWLPSGWLEQGLVLGSSLELLF